MSEPVSKEQPRLRERLDAMCAEMIDRGIYFSEAVEQFEKCFIAEVLRRNKGHLGRAADILGIHRNTLSKRIARYKAKRGSR